MRAEFENGMMTMRNSRGHRGKVHWIHPNPTLDGPAPLCRPGWLKRSSIPEAVGDTREVNCVLCINIKAEQDAKPKHKADA